VHQRDRHTHGQALSVLIVVVLAITTFLARGKPASLYGRGNVSPFLMATITPELSATGTAQTRPMAGVQVAATPIIPVKRATATPPPVPTPTPLPPDINPLSGLKVYDLALLQRRPLLVRIGNDPQIRPQSGLSQAEVVYEELIDHYPLTRLSAIYLASDPEKIGPIRSARLISIQLARQYQAALIHSGASDPVRWEISQAIPANLDEYFHPEPYFYDNTKDWRGRLFTSAPLIREYMRRNGMESKVRTPGFVFSRRGDRPVNGLAAAFVRVPYPNAARVEWKYDAASGRYLRFEGGKPFADAVGRKQIAADNVVIYYAEHQDTGIIEDASGATSINIIIAGEGKAQIIRDGVLIEGRWRTSGDRPAEFFNAAGQPIPLRPGNTWIEVVPTDYEIEVTG
jgi:hypothetical protein